MVARDRTGKHRSAGVLAGAAFAVFLMVSPATAQSVYTTLDLDACTILKEYPETGGFDARCPGIDGHPVYVSEGDARMDVDYGVPSPDFETFGAFNTAGERVEWVSDADGPAAAILRFFVDVDGRSAQALVVSRVGTDAVPGCVVGVVDAAQGQANGVARGLAALARLFDCARDSAVVLAPADSLVATFSPANR